MLPTITHEVNKTTLKRMASSTLDELMENGRIIEAADMIAKMEFFIKELKSNPEYIDFLRYEIAKYGSVHTTPSGTRIELAEVGTKYEYVFCEDDILNDMTIQREALDERIKERQEFLKRLPVEGIDVITSDGEVKRIYPPSKSSTSSVKCTISK
jgi:hypothetical protein